MRSLATFGAAQSTRFASLPSQFIAPSPAREVALEGYRQRNAFLDYLFYDLGVLNAEDATRVAPRYAAEGAILLVGPSSDPSLSLWRNSDDFLRDGPRQAGAIAVAGVGSSALGATAFARNVADAIGYPVLAVVSGYGLSDLISEAIGGFFWFGYLNSVRHLLEPFDEFTRPRTATDTGAGDSHGIVTAVRKSLDVRSLVAVLRSETKFGMLIGHSKGNLVISEALFALREISPATASELAQTTRIVTVSARVAMPSQFENVLDIMGAFDGFGELNSRRSIAIDVRVPSAWHHTNTELPMHLPVTRILREALTPMA